MRIVILILLTVLITNSGSKAAEIYSLELQSINRLYRLHNTEITKTGPAPLVVSIHGYRGREQAIKDRSKLSAIVWDKLDEVALREGFVVANPAAHWGQWSLFRGLKNTKLEDGQDIDDVGFIFKMVDNLIEEGIADPERIYLTGFSDGAIMSYRLLCEPASPFAAAVPTAGTMSEKHSNHCASETPTPLMVIAGTNDLILPYDGWIYKAGREISIPETMEFWRLRHGCARQKTKLLDDVNKADNSRVRLVEWTECIQEGAVKLLRVEGGGHTSPSYDPVSENWLKKAGGHNQDIESADEVWKFFNVFRLPKPND